MARALTPPRRRRHKATPEHNPAPGNPLHGYLDAYCEWALATGLSEHTVTTRRFKCQQFIVWCDERGITQPTEFTRPIIERYQRHLYQHRKPDGSALSVFGQLARLHALISWVRWMVRQHHMLHNPAADLELPPKPRVLPKTLLSVQQAEAVLATADPGTLQGLRNRAILEVFYSSGMRRMELMGLKLHDIDTERGTVMIRQGKGSKDRFIPLGERACAWIDKYLAEVRGELVGIDDDRSLFLDDFGRPLSAHFLGDVVRRHLEAGGITTPGACHVFRHACATHMLEGGADIRFIQAMLGHAKLDTTQLYTHLSIVKLKEIHSATHPARLQRRGGAQNAAGGVSLDEARQTLLSAIADEGDEEREGAAGGVAADAERRR